MCIEIKFDFDSFKIFVPDGYLTTVDETVNLFLEWMEEQPECIAKKGYKYNEETFLKWLNSVVLNEFNEKAYFIKQNNIPTKMIINF